MDETRATRFPPGRYGRRREHTGLPKWLAVVGAALTIVAGVGVAVKLYDQYGAEYSSDVLAFETSERSVHVTFSVYKPEGEEAQCRVRARAENGAEVGYADVPITAEDSYVTVEYTLETSARPVTGEVQRCYPAQ